MSEVSCPPRRRPPLVDRDTLHTLEGQFDDPIIVRTFVRDFVSVWDERYLRLSHAVERGEDTAALDAVLSLKTASIMVGAARLAQLATDLEETVRARDTPAARSALPAIQACGLQTIRVLTLGNASGAE